MNREYAPRLGLLDAYPIEKNDAKPSQDIFYPEQKDNICEAFILFLMDGPKNKTDKILCFINPLC